LYHGYQLPVTKSLKLWWPFHFLFEFEGESMRILGLLVLFLVLLPVQSRAAEPVPGEACSPAGATIASAEGANGHFMICESGTWKSLYSYNSSGAFTKMGNQTCAGGQILKFNGTIWACAADNAGSSGITALTGDVTASGTGSVVATIEANAVGSGEIADGSVANADLAGSIAVSKLSVPGGTTSFLRADGTWVAPPAGADNLGNHTATTTLALGANGVTSSAGTIIDGGGGWHRTYGDTGWFNGTYGGGWYMNDSTWLKAYGDKGIYTASEIRSQSQMQTPILYDLNNGGYYWNGDGTSSMNVVYAYSYYYHSDERLKEDIKPIPPTLDKVKQLNGVRYVFKQDKEKTPHLGLIAQNVQKFFPDVVSKGPDGYLAIDYPALVPVLIEAIKEQDRRYGLLERQVAGLETQLKDAPPPAPKGAALTPGDAPKPLMLPDPSKPKDDKDDKGDGFHEPE
jgi:hypothetical protein